MSSAASIRSASSRPPAIRPARRARVVGDLGVAQLRPLGRVEDPRGLGPDGGPARRRRGPTSVSRAWARAGPASAVCEQRSAARPGSMPAANVVSIRQTRARRTPSCCAAAIAIAFSVVKSYWAATASLAAAPGRVGLDVALEVERRAARRCRAVASWPTSVTSSGARAGCRSPRIAVRARIEDAAPRSPSRGTSRRVKRRRQARSRWVSIGRSSVRLSGRPDVVGREVGCREGLATSSLTCLPSARPRVRGASQPMTLPMSRADDAPVAAIALVDERGDLVLGQSGSGRYSPRIAISASSFAARSSRPPARKASTDSRRVLTSRVRTPGTRRRSASRRCASRRCRRRSRPSAGRRDAARHPTASRR